MSVKKIEFSSDQTQELFRLYETERLNTRKIAKTFNVSQSTIIRILRENNKLKTISEACKGRLVWNKDKTNIFIYLNTQIIVVK